MSNDDLNNPSPFPQDRASPAYETMTENTKKQDGWERDLLEKLAFATLKEQRARRRWGIFFKLVTLSIVLLVFWRAFDLGGAGPDVVSRHTALINIDGTIESGGSGAAEAVIPALNRAYTDAGAVGVILHINSPGGSPVQAGMINDEIARLRKTYPKKPLYVVVDEICASGGYYIAAAADRIYVDKASIVGSIGVLMDSFGFTELMEKMGIERRLMTAGKNKALMDPFSAQTPEQMAYMQSMLDEIHQQFIAVVRQGRGSRLKESPEMFSGLFWSGAKAVEVGLADGFGTIDSVARDVVKAEEIIDYTEYEGLSDRVLKQFGASVGAGVVNSLWSGASPSVR